MGMCSRQERIQKDIDVVIQKCKAEKDCLFAGEFVPGRQVGSAEAPVAAAAPAPDRAPAVPVSFAAVPGRGAALRPRLPPLLPRAYEGRGDRAPAGKGAGGLGGGIPSAAVATRSTGSAGCEPEPSPSPAQPAAERSSGLSLRGSCRLPAPGRGTSSRRRALSVPAAPAALPRDSRRCRCGAGRAEPSQEPGCRLPVAVCDNGIPCRCHSTGHLLRGAGGRCCISSGSPRLPFHRLRVGSGMPLRSYSATSAKIKTSCNKAALCLSDFRYSDSTFTFTYIGGSKRYFFYSNGSISWWQ